MDFHGILTNAVSFDVHQPMKSRRPDGNPTKERLFAAGKKLFALKPYDEVAIDDIADEAGVAHGLLFHYFKSKLDFYLYVFHVDRDDMQRRRAEVTRDGTPDKRLRRFVEFHMNHLREWPWSHVLLLRGGAPAKLVAEAEVVRHGQRPRSPRLFLARSAHGA